MAKKKVYVCFDYDRDKHYKYLMNAWNTNPDFDFSFNSLDLLRQEINLIQKHSQFQRSGVRVVANRVLCQNLQVFCFCLPKAAS